MSALESGSESDKYSVSNNKKESQKSEKHSDQDPEISEASIQRLKLNLKQLKQQIAKKEDVFSDTREALSEQYKVLEMDKNEWKKKALNDKKKLNTLK